MPKLTLTFDPVTQNQLGSSSHHSQYTCEVWKWLGENCCLYSFHKVLYIECQSWPWSLNSWPKINKLPPLIIHNLHVKFERGWKKNFSCYRVHKVKRDGRTHARTHSLTQSLKHPLTHSTNHRRTDDPKLIGFLLSSSTTYMWSLKGVGKKL